MPKALYMIVSLAGIALCFTSISSIYGQTANVAPDTLNLWNAAISAMSGAALTSGSFFFFVKRIISQYDEKHEKHEEDIADMQKTAKNIENNFMKSLDDSTDLIMKSLDNLKDNIREIITDVAVLKDDRRRCVNLNDRLDNNNSGLKVLQAQYESMISTLARLEKQIEKKSRP